MYSELSSCGTSCFFPEVRWTAVRKFEVNVPRYAQYGGSLLSSDSSRLSVTVEVESSSWTYALVANLKKGTHCSIA
jgi:hypothetical protein